VSELSPRVTDACQARKNVLVAGLVLILGCSSPPKPNYTRTQPEGDPPPAEHKPIEARRTNRAETRVDSTVQEPEALTGVVVIKTWADEVVKGRVLSETDAALVLDVGPLDGSNPKPRRVPRSAIMEIKKAGRAP